MTATCVDEIANHLGEARLDAVACEIASDTLGREINPHELREFSHDPTNTQTENEIHMRAICKHAIDLAERIARRLELG